MNQIEIFNSPEFGSIRIVEENGKYLFCGADVAKSLGYKDTVNALKTHCREDGVAFTTSPIVWGVNRKLNSSAKETCIA